MAVAERTRALTAELYLTDGLSELLYVLEVDEQGWILVEDARTLEQRRMKATKLDGWRIVEPEHG